MCIQFTLIAHDAVVYWIDLRLLKVFLCVCFYLGRAWICYSWPGRKFRSWKKRRARIFSESLKKNCNGVFQQWNSGQLKYYSLHVTGSPGTSWCTRGQWTSGLSRPARTTRVTRNICEGNMDQMMIVPWYRYHGITLYRVLSVQPNVFSMTCQKCLNMF